MTELEALKLVKIIQSAYPRQPFPADTVRIYALALADLPATLGQQAVMELVRASKWTPTIAEIRQRAAEIACPLPTPTEALDEVQQAARDFSPGRSSNTKQPSPMAIDALESVGGMWTFAQSTRPEEVRRQFLAAYTERRARWMEHLQVTPGVLEHPPQYRRALPDFDSSLPELTDEEERHLEWWGRQHEYFREQRRLKKAAEEGTE